MITLSRSTARRDPMRPCSCSRSPSTSENEGSEIRPDKVRGSIRASHRRDAAAEAGRAAGGGEAFPPPRAVPDLMEAFRKSLASVQAETANDDGMPAKAARPKKPKAKVEGQREMLLPIAGGKAEAEGKPAKAPRRKAG